MQKLIIKILIKTGVDEFDAKFISFFTSLTIGILLVVQFCLGLAHANNPDKCNVKSIGDIIIAPTYAIGCNINKERFYIKLN